MRDLVFETENYKLETEWFENKPFLHCEVYKWNISIYKKLVKDWNGFLSILKDNQINEWYSIIPKGDSKLLKFQKLFGLQILKETETHYLMRGK